MKTNINEDQLYFISDISAHYGELIPFTIEYVTISGRVQFCGIIREKQLDQWLNFGPILLLFDH
jgi:hypothetical protein